MNPFLSLAAAAGAGAALLFTSIAPAEARRERVTHFQCDGGRTLFIVYRPGRIVVRMAGETFNLPQRRTGAGLLYSGNAVEWREKGRQGFIRVRDGFSARCAAYVPKRRPRGRQEARWRCEGGREVHVIYRPKNRIILYIGFERFDLRQGRSGSGVAYSGKTVNWSEKGSDGFIRVREGFAARCTRLSLKRR